MTPFLLSKSFVCGPVGWLPLGATIADPVDGVLAAHDVLEHGVASFDNPVFDELCAFGAFGFIRGYDPQFEPLPMDLALTFRDVLVGALPLPGDLSRSSIAQCFADLPEDIARVQSESLTGCLASLANAVEQQYWGWVELPLSSEQSRLAHKILEPAFGLACKDVMAFGYKAAHAVFGNRQRAKVAFEKLSALADCAFNSPTLAKPGCVLTLGYDVQTQQAFFHEGLRLP